MSANEIRNSSSPSSISFNAITSTTNRIRNINDSKSLLSIYSLRFGFDIIACCFLIGAFLTAYFADPYERGFNCDDDSIRYPYKPNTIEGSTLTIICIAICITIILLNEIYLYRTKFAPRFVQMKKSILWQLYSSLIPLLFTMLASQIIVDISKVSIGRLRPHFIDVCRPLIVDQSISNQSIIIDRFSDCSQLKSPYTYITDFKCTNTKFNDKILRDSRLSFMSGHSAIVSVTMIYITLYIQYHAKLLFNNFGLLKPLIQYILIAFAIYVGFTRISDYKHHWSDVLIGLIEGAITASFGFRYSREFRNNLEKSLQSNSSSSSNSSSTSNSSSSQHRPSSPRQERYSVPQQQQQQQQSSAIVLNGGIDESSVA